MNRLFSSIIFYSIASLVIDNCNSLPQVNPYARPDLPPPPPPPPFQPQYQPNPIQGPFIPILQQAFDISPDGSYTFSYQSADGSSRQESGGLKYANVPGAEPALSVQGSYQYVLPDGQQTEVQYIADENGFQPSGPGIHPAIQRAVALQVAEAKGQLPQPINGPYPVPPPNGPYPVPAPNGPYPVPAPNTPYPAPPPNGPAGPYRVPVPIPPYPSPLPNPQPTIHSNSK